MPRDVRERLEELIGPKPTEGGRLPAVIVAGPGQALTHRAELVLEDGTELGRLDRLPRDVPFGYHQLRTGRSEALLVCGPGRCPPPRGHSWGWAVQLYAARSRASWGIGDLADLRDLARWSAGLGAGFLVVNPLNAETPAHRIQPSPYFPSSRRFHSPLYLRMEDVPGAGALGDRLERLAAAGRALNGGSRIDRDAVFRLKMDALEAIWETSPPTPGLAAFRAAHGSVLREWATFAAIAERHGAGWSRWPGELRRPAGAAVARFAAAHADRIAFHEWVQWLIDDQLRRAAEPLQPFA
ncbi:MAG TPA: 4-alpha-glucanotransferase, partial [Candidatus Limnocylindria bacterium]|nr:4-alpha-glucanotransferase [Candidatus Limnocylindria bacterium]